MSEDTADLPPAKRTKIEVDNDSQEPEYGVHVSAEEVEKLRQFKVLDEVKSDDEDSNDEGSNKSSSDEVPEEEIERMLEEDLPEEFKGAAKPLEKKYVKQQKIVLEQKGINHFEVLPLDWMMVPHASGMPVYMHRGTRVCTLSKPYFLGKENTRRHDIPISAIPCLAYRIALREEQAQAEVDRQIAEQIRDGSWAHHAADNHDQGPANHDQVPANHDQVPANHDQAQNTENETNGAENQIHLQSIQSITIKTEESHNSHSTPVECGETSQNSQEIPQCPYSNNNTVLPNSPSNLPYKPTKLTQRPPDLPENSPDLPENPPDLPQNPPDLLQNASVSEHSNGSLPEKLECPYQSQLRHLKDEAKESTGSEASNPEASNLEASNPEASNPEENIYLNEVLEGSPGAPACNPLRARPVVLPGGLVMPPPRVETVNTSWKAQQLSATQLNDYCKKLFKFKEVSVMHFKRWADRRKYTKARKTMQYPTLPEGTKLITMPADNAPEHGAGKSAKRDWVMNMNGGSYLSVFHEYVRRALHKQPVYHFEQLENASAPYQATVYIGGMQYGVGQGSSKRQAKSQAARASIHILIPEMRDELPSCANELNRCKDEPDFSFFDYVTIEDPRIQEFCGAAAEPSPHAILRTCLLRNFGAQDRHIHTEMKKLEFQKIELTMKVGKHSATVVCKNKKQAKQRASQAILQQLHPHITSWGSLLRLYGSRSMKSCKEKKLEEQQITLLQDKARRNEPNHAVLEKLRYEMSKLKERDEAVAPLGSLMLTAELPSHSGSNLNNVDL